MAAVLVVPRMKAVQHLSGQGAETVASIPGAALVSEEGGTVTFTLYGDTFQLTDTMWFIFMSTQVYGILYDEDFQAQYMEVPA